MAGAAVFEAPVNTEVKEASAAATAAVAGDSRLCNSSGFSDNSIYSSSPSKSKSCSMGENKHIGRKF